MKRLCTHEDAQVRRLSRRLCQKWNNFFKEQEKLVPVEVKSDSSTTKVRNTTRSFIAKAFAEEVILFFFFSYLNFFFYFLVYLVIISKMINS